MATIRWRGDAAAVAQINTVTPANVGIGNTFTITINGKAITYTAVAATVSDVTAGLVALFLASTHPEFLEITPTDSTTHVTLTAVTAGKPFTQTSTAAGGTATNTTATSTASSGPNDWSVATNWLIGTNEVQTVTITGTPTGGNFTLTFSGQTTGNVAHNANAATLQTALEAISTIGSGNVLVGGGPGPGTPYTVTFQGVLAAQNVPQMTAAHTFTGGSSPAIAVTTTTAGSDIGTGTVPVTNDTVYLDNPVDILYGLDQTGITLTALYIPSTFTAALGLPGHNGAYWEYRAKELNISATTIVVGDGPGAGSRHLRINTGTVQTTLIVKNTSNTPAEANTQCLRWRGTHASNVTEVLKGNVGIAKQSGVSAKVATLHVGFISNVDADAVVHCGSETTLTTINKSGGQLTIDSNSTTINQTGGTLTLSGGTVTTLTVDTGTVIQNSTGTITTLNIGNEGVFQRADMRAATITTVNMYKGAALSDPFGVITYTNPINLIRCRPTEVTIDVGEDRTLAVAG